MKNAYSTGSRDLGITVLTMASLLICCAQAQTTQPAAGKLQQAQKATDIEDAIASVKNGVFTFNDIEVIAAAPADARMAALPVLESQFGSSTEVVDKERIAGALLRLGDKNGTYWTFLAAKAGAAADDDAPFFLDLNQNGQVSATLAPDFLRWAADRHIPTSDAFNLVEYMDPSAIDILGYTQDQRAIPILRRALSSPNFFVEASAAKGLANIHDVDSVPLIIGACSRAPAEMAARIALPLAYFDEKEAQRAVELYVPTEEAANARRARSEGLTAYGTGSRPKRSGP